MRKYLSLLQGITETHDYKASKFPGGEVQIKFKSTFFNQLTDEVSIDARINTSDNIILLGLAADTIRRSHPDIHITAKINYMPYQQSDREFSKEECIGLRTICKILRSFGIDRYEILDAHSDSTGNLLDPKSRGRSVISDNSHFVRQVLSSIGGSSGYEFKDYLTMLSPDTGAYKKIFKLCEGIKFSGVIESATKYRDEEGNLKQNISCTDFGGRDIIIVDDICLGGRTFTELYDRIQHRNIGRCYLAISHGIFNNGFSELVKRFERIYTTTSWRSEESIKNQLREEHIDSARVAVYNVF